MILFILYRQSGAVFTLQTKIYVINAPDVWNARGLSCTLGRWWPPSDQAFDILKNKKLWGLHYENPTQGQPTRDHSIGVGLVSLALCRLFPSPRAVPPAPLVGSLHPKLLQFFLPRPAPGAVPPAPVLQARPALAAPAVLQFQLQLGITSVDHCLTGFKPHFTNGHIGSSYFEHTLNGQTDVSVQPTVYDYMYDNGWQDAPQCSGTQARTCGGFGGANGINGLPSACNFKDPLPKQNDCQGAVNGLDFYPATASCVTS